MTSDVDQSGLQPATPEQAHGTDALKSGTPVRKNIVVCCDGTGNEFARAGAKNANSNIVKLYTALQLDESQYAYYHPGVGTMGDPTKKGVGRAWSVVTGMAFGGGFEEHVLDAYRYLMQHYNHGDTVFLFGFSRGSYCARALAGLLHGYGLLCRGNEGHLPYAWRMYKDEVKRQRKLKSGKTETDYSFRDTFSHKDFMIRFVGLFDTVSSVGWVSTPLRLLHLAQNATIMYGRHAVSIDERRCFFQDNLWGPPTEIEVPPNLKFKRAERKVPDAQSIKQVWFAGVHSDVGGSYPQKDSGLANIALEWMMNEAETFGVNFDPEFKLKVAASRRKAVLGEPIAQAEDPNGELASLVPIYTPAQSSKVNVSLKWYWWPLEIFPHRYYTSDDTREKMRVPLGAYREIPDGALVHHTAYERFHDAGARYRPRNLRQGELSVPDAAGLSVFTRKGHAFQWREVQPLVLVVALLELAAGLWLAKWLLILAGHLLDWLLQFCVWLRRVVLPHGDLNGLAARSDELWKRAGGFFAAHAFAWHWMWPLALAAVIVVVHFIVMGVRFVVGKVWSSGASG